MKLTITLVFVIAIRSAFAQWTGQTSSSDITSQIYRTGIISIDTYNSAQIRLNSSGTYYGKIGNPSPQVWSLGWGGSTSDINPVLSWTATGNVGIGTFGAGGKLDINAGSQYAIRTLTSSRYVIEVRNSSSPNGGWWLANDPSGSFAIHENNVGDKFTIASGGNVGIGTTSPLSKIHINSSIERETFRIYKQGNTANYLSFWQGTGGGVLDPIGTGLLHLGYDQSTNVIMGYTGAGVNSGNVGIGTPNPDAKLAVKGQIHAQEVKVDLNGAVAPDYVFASNYQLPTLDYIKTYIDQNKHLPEIPSAKEMETNGVKLGEMNMLLLKKIEELTLHMINLQKENEQLKNRVLTIEQKGK